MASQLEKPEAVVMYLNDAKRALSDAHRMASERDESEEGVLTDLSGDVRDMLYGLGSAVDALIGMIEEGRFAGAQVQRTDG